MDGAALRGLRAAKIRAPPPSAILAPARVASAAYNTKTKTKTKQHFKKIQVRLSLEEETLRDLFYGLSRTVLPAPFAVSSAPLQI